MDWIVIFLFLLNLLNVAESSQIDQDKIEELENRLSKLEKIVEELEPTLVRKYGLVKRCIVPPVEHGFAQCDSTVDIKPKDKCKVVCYAGYIATPGKDVTHCLDGGGWTVDMKCEVPLVIVGGGEISDSSGDSSFEVIDFEGREKCNISIPDMRTERTLYNLIYEPKGPNILACNGLSSSESAICDKWGMTGSNQSWTYHSRPHRESYELRKYGRYAAESMTIDNEPVILGGMVNKGNIHQVTNDSSIYDVIWIPCQLRTRRAFFCAVKLQESVYINTGGIGSDLNVLKTVSFRKCWRREYVYPIQKRDLPDIPSPLSGHGCAGLPDSYDFIVAGGSRTQRDDSQSDSYIYSWGDNSWNKTDSMKTARFGHKLVTVGQNIFAIGGKQRNLNKYLDSIEIFDTQKRKWNNFGQSLKKPRAHFGLALVPRSTFPGCK